MPAYLAIQPLLMRIRVGLAKRIGVLPFILEAYESDRHCLFTIVGPKEFLVRTERGCRIISKDHGEQSQIFDGFKGEKATCPKRRGDLKRRNGDDSGVHG